MRVLSLCVSIVAAGLALGQEASRFGTIPDPPWDELIYVNKTFTAVFNATQARQPILYIDWYITGVNATPPYLVHRDTHHKNATITYLNVTLPVIDSEDPTGNIGYKPDVLYTITAMTTLLTADGSPAVTSITNFLNVSLST